jgi:hypothetical protein
MKQVLRIVALLEIFFAFAFVSAHPREEVVQVDRITMVTAGGGCNKVAPVTQDVGAVTLCVEEAIANAVAAGATTFEDIASAVGTACGIITVQEVTNIINLWENGPSNDAGTLVFKSAKVAQMMQDPVFVLKLRAVKSKGK